MAEIGIQIAEALEHAHRLGVVHRDVKPANLLLDDAGTPWITDFGLAQLERDAALTMDGEGETPFDADRCATRQKLQRSANDRRHVALTTREPARWRIRIAIE